MNTVYETKQGYFINVVFDGDMVGIRPYDVEDFDETWVDVDYFSEIVEREGWKLLAKLGVQ